MHVKPQVTEALLIFFTIFFSLCASVCFYFPALFRYTWQIKIVYIYVYSVLFWYMYALWNDNQNQAN